MKKLTGDPFSARNPLAVLAKVMLRQAENEKDAVAAEQNARVAQKANDAAAIQPVLPKLN